MGKETQPDKIEKLEKDVAGVLDDVERLWLSQGNFVSGNEVSVADIFAACEIEQLRKLCYLIYKSTGKKYLPIYDTNNYHHCLINL